MMAQVSKTLITNVKIHVGNGQLIENGSIEIDEKGLLTVSTNGTGKAGNGVTVIDGKGLQAYPGFIAANSRLGLEEIEAVRATRDYAEVGEFNPNVRSLIAYNTDSDILPTVRSNGILLAQVCPVGGRISGQSSIMSTESFDNWEERAYKADDGIHLNWPGRYQYTGWWAEPGSVKKEDGYDEQVKGIKDYFKEAAAYLEQPVPPVKNVRFEAMRNVLEGKANLYIHVDDAKSILEALRLAKELKVKAVIVGGRDSWMVADVLKEQGVGVILEGTQNLPAREDDDIDLPYKTPALLQASGVLFCISAEGSWKNRNLPYHAAEAVSYGLPYEAGVASISYNTAKILGIDKYTGSLETGKEATLFLSNGDALDFKGGSMVVNAWVEGRPVSLDDKQKALFRQYKTKYGLDK